MTIASIAAWLPAGYALIPGATFAGETLGDFGFKQMPVTNGEWGDWVRTLGEDRFVLMHHDWNTGATKILHRGRDAEAVLGGKQERNWNAGDILISGSLLLFRLLENPSQLFDEEEKARIFSEERQPALVSYFESMAWCLLKTAASGGRLTYDLPTDAQYEYVASNNGAQKYGTSTGDLLGPEGQVVAYLGEYRDGRGMTISVDDLRNSFVPMGVQATGNVWRWIRFNRGETYKYGLRGGSWCSAPQGGIAAVRVSDSRAISLRNEGYGFQPAVVPQIN